MFAFKTIVYLVLANVTATAAMLIFLSFDFDSFAYAQKGYIDDEMFRKSYFFFFSIFADVSNLLHTISIVCDKLVTSKEKKVWIVFGDWCLCFFTLRSKQSKNFDEHTEEQTWPIIYTS